jgi:hypothetical protein
MKTFLTSAYLFLTTLCFGQTVQTDKVFMEAKANYKPATVELFKRKDQILSMQSHGGKLKFRNLETDYYSFLISGRGQLTVRTDSILVQKGQLLELNVALNGPCLYDHPVDKIPACPKNHTDNIIPIVYGLIGQTTDSKDDEIHLGGCIMSDCDPKYYCKKHQIEF